MDSLRDHYDDDDNSFVIKSSNHPMLNGQDFNAMGRFKRVFQEHRIHRKVKRVHNRYFANATICL